MGKNKPLILASTSRYRAALLSQLGWEFTAISPEVDEEALKDGSLSPENLALLLSQKKARAVALKRPDAIIIGSDQVCCLGEDILSKPGTREKAIEQLLKLQGKTHELLTAVTLVSHDRNKSFLNKTRLHMRLLNEAQIARYVDADKPFDCAGSYKLEAAGIRLFENIEMSDQTAIIGLPLIELTTHLLAWGFEL